MTTEVARRIETDIPLNAFYPKMVEESDQHVFVQAEYDACLDAFTGLGRGDGYQAFISESTVIYSLAEMLSRRVAGKHNKNVIFILFGDLGAGKSMALLKLALSCAMWLAALCGGRPSDYFRFSNIAIIDPEMLQDKLANLLKRNIYILDDAGPGYDARTFMSKGNRDLNYILQTCRTSNNIILVSAPHGAMLDVTIHRVAQYYAEVSEVRHDQGISFLKVFRLVRVFRQGKIFYVYMTKGGVTIRRFWTALPPKQLKDRYDVVRDAQAKIVAERREKREAEEAEKNEGGRKSRGTVRLDIEKVKRIRESIEKNPHQHKSGLGDIVGAHQGNIGRYLKAAGATWCGTRKNPDWELSPTWGDLD